MGEQKAQKPGFMEERIIIGLISNPGFVKNRKGDAGFTIIELVIALIIASIVMTAIYSVYAAQQISYLTQEQVTAMHQNLRSAMYHMEREIRMAGCDPTGEAGAGIVTANLNLLRWQNPAAEQEGRSIVTLGYKKAF